MYMEANDSFKKVDKMITVTNTTNGKSVEATVEMINGVEYINLGMGKDWEGKEYTQYDTRENLRNVHTCVFSDEATKTTAEEIEVVVSTLKNGKKEYRTYRNGVKTDKKRVSDRDYAFASVVIKADGTLLSSSFSNNPNTFAKLHGVWQSEGAKTFVILVK